MKMSEDVKKCIREAVVIPFATGGTAKDNWGAPPYGVHMLQTRSDIITFVDDETIAWPSIGVHRTISNLGENGKLQILATAVKNGKIVNGYTIEGAGKFETEGPIFEKLKKHGWATGCVVLKAEKISQSGFLTKILMKI